MTHAKRIAQRLGDARYSIPAAVSMTAMNGDP